MTNLEKLNHAFCEALNVEESQLEGLTYKSVTGWDSVGHMLLISNLSETFTIEMTFEDVVSLQSYEDAKDILSKYGVDL